MALTHILHIPFTGIKGIQIKIYYYVYLAKLNWLLFFNGDYLMKVATSPGPSAPLSFITPAQTCRSIRHRHQERVETHGLLEAWAQTGTHQHFPCFPLAKTGHRASTDLGETDSTS